MKYLDPKNDLTFKKVFGQHPHLLKSFLNALLPLAEGQIIESLQYLPTELVPEIPVLKNTIVDVRCTDNFGRQFIVEMQMLWTDSFRNRILFNASKAYIKQLEKTKEYKLLQPVYALSLINDTFEHQLPDFYHHYQIVNLLHPERQLKGLEFVFIELPKFKPQNISDKKLQILWLRYLTEIEDGTQNISAELFENIEIKEALEHIQESSFSKDELEQYDRYWDSVRTEKTLYLDAEIKGKAEGKAEGRAEGELINSYKVCISALRMNLKREDINKLTNLPFEEINKLFQLLQKYGDNAENHLTEI